MTALGARTAASRTTLPSYGRPLWRRILLSPEALIIAVLIAVVLIAAETVPYFAGTNTVYFLLLDAAPVLMIALPMTLVIITGEIDLSVASIIGLSSVLFGVLIRAGVPVAVAIVVCIAIGFGAGAFNGFFVTVVGLPSLAVTIGTLALFRGLAVGILGTTAITEFPLDWQNLAQLRLGASGIPAISLLVLVLIAVFVVVLHYTPFGRGLYALGLSAAAAHFSGVHVNRSKFVTFLLSGAVSALAGVFWTLRFGSARGDNANGLELSIIAAVLLGGVSIFGGKGSILGVIGGVLLISVLQSALRLAGVSSDAINVVTGALLILSVLAPRVPDWFRALRHRAPPVP
ncbi:ABC transporter permease [Microbacterium terrisoli]|uniref:ABC transporter permease n=1 Tax=Microbacterium terrisoli TaxID=3242192 RepID=UPI00280454D6|nr:ABC transporter permease [Microbacterium protaetiae]